MEIQLELARGGFGEKGFSAAARPIEQNAVSIKTIAGVLLWIKTALHHFANLLFSIFHAPNVGEADLGHAQFGDSLLNSIRRSSIVGRSYAHTLPPRLRPREQYPQKPKPPHSAQRKQNRTKLVGRQGPTSHLMLLEEICYEHRIKDDAGKCDHC